jgi:hypothetical protein
MEMALLPGCTGFDAVVGVAANWGICVPVFGFYSLISTGRRLPG